MGYLFVLGQCAACKQSFTFHPHRVPSIRVNGEREPVCRACVEMANQRRQVSGLPLITVLPGAYEVMDEAEGW
jgi:hypothetical protein